LWYLHLLLVLMVDRFPGCADCYSCRRRFGHMHLLVMVLRCLGLLLGSSRLLLLMLMVFMFQYRSCSSHSSDGLGTVKRVMLWGRLRHQWLLRLLLMLKVLMF
jgi:hypothetical protein